MEEKRRIDDEEINLYDYFMVIRKRLKLILGIFLIALLVAGVISFLMPSVYRVSAMITPGYLFVDDLETGRLTTVPIDTLENIIASINNDGYNAGIIESLKLDPAEAAIDLNAEILRDAEIIRITHYTGDISLGKRIVDELLNQIDKFYSDRVSINRGGLGASIRIVENEIKKREGQKESLRIQKTEVANENKEIENQKTMIETQKRMIGLQKKTIETQKEVINNDKIKLSNQKVRLTHDKDRLANAKKGILSNIKFENERLALLKGAEKELMKQLKKIEENTRIIMQQRAGLIGGEQGDPISLLLFSNMIQHNIAHGDTIRAQLDRNRLDQESAKSVIRKFEIGLANKDIDLKKLSSKVDDIDVSLKNLDIKIGGEEIALLERDVRIEDENAKLRGLDILLRGKEADLLRIDVALGGEEIAIDNIIQEVEKLKLNKRQVESIRVVKEPAVDPNPVKPRKGLNIAIAGITSLFLGVFLAFSIEWFSKGKRRLDE